MLHDEPWETWDGEDNSSSHLIVKKFIDSDKTSIPKFLREDLGERGWKFGHTIVCVLECCCCSGDRPGAEDRKKFWLEAESLMAGDLDATISTLSSMRNYAEE
jgi:hypothetical protein